MLNPHSVTPDQGARSTGRRQRPPKCEAARKPPKRCALRDLRGKDGLRPKGWREDGLTIERELLRVISNLVKRHGVCFASEASLNRMLWEDCHRAAGESVIRHRLYELREQGVIVMLHLEGGGDALPNGERCTYGTRLIYIPQTREGRRALEAVERMKERGQQLKISRRVGMADGMRIIQGLKPRRLTPAQQERERAHREAGVDDFLATLPPERAAFLRAQLEAERARGRPPD